VLIALIKLNTLNNNKNKNSHFAIKNKIVIVSGASRGIGNRIASELQKHEAIVYGFGRTSPKKTDKKLNYTEIDINNHNKVKIFLKKIYQKHRRIDGLVNVAGISIPKTYEIVEFRKSIETNLISTFNLCKETLVLMKKKKYGSIINLTSIGAFKGFSNNPGYVSSKAALNSLTKAMAMDYGKYNIRINNLVPGYIKTKMTEKSYKNINKSNTRISRTILNRWGETDDLIGSTIFLLSDASKYITGSDLFVDGGFSNKGI